MTRDGPVLLLDPLRFGCALFVVLHHFGAILPSSPPPLIEPLAAGAGLTAGLGAWTWPGWIGVEVFFVLSGYVIARSVGALGPGRASMRDFVRRRALRLLPAAWICATATAVVTLALGTIPAAAVFHRWSRALPLFPGDPPIDGSYWTLPIEVAFYALVAVAVRRRGGGEATLRRLGVLLTLASALFWTARAAGLVRDPDTFDWLLLPHGAFFALGIWISRAHAGTLTAGGAAWAGVAVATGVVQIADRSRVLAALFGLPERPAVPLALWFAALALIASAPAWQRPLARVGAGRLRALGLASYPLYLLHQNIGGAAIVGLRLAGWSMGAAVALVTLAMVAAAGGVASHAEPWLRARLRAVSLSPRPRLRRGPAPDSRRSASPPAG
jgi:peptidoglycan/LPS O-acetylase OafA/YrhL